MAGKDMALALILQLKDELSGAIGEPTKKVSGFGTAVANVGKIAAGVALAGIGAMIGGLALCVKSATEAQQVEAQLDAVLKSTGAAATKQAVEFAKASTTWVTSTKLSAEAAKQLSDKLGDLTRKQSTLGVEIVEQRENVKELTARWGENGLATIKAKNKLADMEQESGKLTTEIGKLTKQVADGATPKIMTLAEKMGLTAPAAQMAKDELLKLADSLSSVTRFDDEAIISAESLLLTFKGIGKDIFPDVISMATDMSTALGTDLVGATQQLGIALASPAEGLSRLKRSGVVFTDAQEEMIKKMVAGGKVADAQKYILAELATKFGGAAVASGKTFAGQLDILKNSMENVQETIGAALLPALTGLATGLVTALKGPAVQAAIANITAWLSTAIPAALAFLQSTWKTIWPTISATLQTVWGIIQTIFQTLLAWVTTNWPIIQSIIVAAWQTIISVIQFAITTIVPVILSIFQTILTWVTTNWPMIQSIIVAAWQIISSAIQTVITTVLPILITAFQTILTWVTTNWPMIQSIIVAAWQVISSAIQAVITTVLPVLISAFQTILGWVTANWPMIQSIIKGVWDAIQSVIMTVINTVVPFIISMFQQVVAWVTANWPMIQSIIKGVWDAILSVIKTVINDVVPLVIAKFQMIASWVKENWPTIQGIIKTVFDAISKIITTVITEIVPKVISGFQQIMGWVKENWPRIEAIIKKVWDVILSIINTVVSNVVPFIMSEFGKVVAWVNENWPLIQKTIETVLDAVLKVVETVLATITKFWEEHGATIMKIISLAWDTIKTIVSTAINIVLGIIKAIMQAINGDWKGAWETIKKTAEGVLKALETIVTNTVNMILAIFGTSLTDIGAKVGEFVTAGKGLVMGLVKGIVDSVDALKDAIVNAVKAAIAAAKEFLGIKCPDPVPAFAEMGYGMMEGLAQGIERGAGAPMRALQQLFLAPAVGLITQFAGIINQLMSLFWEVGAEESLNRVRLVMDTIKSISDTIMSAITAAAAIAGKTADLDALAIEMTTLFRSLRAAMLTIINEVRWFDTQDIGVAGQLVGVYQAIIAPLKEAFVITREFKGVTVDAAALGATAVAFFAAMDEVVRAIRDAAERMGVEGLGAANAFAVTVAAVVGVISSGVAALTAIADYKAVADFAARAAMFATDLVTGVTAIKDALVKVTDLKPFEAASAWATAIGSAVAIIKPAIDALVALAEYKPVTGIAAKMKTIADQIGTAILEFSRVSTWRETMKPWETAGTWATAVGAAVGLVKGVVDALTALGEYKPVIGIAAKMTTIANQIATAILEFARVATWRETMKPWETAGVWATAVTSAVGIIKSVVDALTALGDYKPVVGIAAKMTTIANQIGTAILEFARVVAWRETMKPWEAAGQWATAIAPAVGLIKGAVDALAALTTYKPVENLVEKAALFATQLADALDQMIEGIEVIGRSIESWTKASAWATAVGPAVGLIKNAVDALANLAEYKPVENLVEKAASFGTQLADALDQMIEGIAVVGRKIEEWKALSDWATAVRPALDSIKSMVDGLTALAAYEPIAGLDTLATNMFSILSKVLYELDYAVKHWSEYVKDWTIGSAFATAIGPAVNGIKGMVDGLTALAEYQPAVGLKDKATALFDNIAAALAEMKRAVDYWTPIVVDWAVGSTWATAVKPAIDIIKSAVDALLALATYVEPADMTARITAFVASLSLALSQIATAAATKAPEIWAAAGVFATNVMPAVALMKAGLEALDALADFGTEYITPEKIDVFVDVIRYTVEMIAWVSYQIAPVAVQAAAAFATQTQVVWQSMKDALAFLGDLNAAALPNEEKVNAFVATLTRLLNALGTALGTSADIAATTGAIAANLTGAGNIDIPPLVPGSLPHPMPNLDWTGIIGRPRAATGGAGGGGGGGGGGATLSDRVYDILVEIRDILAEELALGSSRTTLATREAIYDALGPIVSESLRRQGKRGVAA